MTQLDLPLILPFKEFMRLQIRLYWKELLEETDNNVARAARIAGVNRTNLYKIFEKYDIREPQQRHLGNWE